MALLLLGVFMLDVSADTADTYIAEQLEAGGAATLWEQLDADTREMFEKVGVSTLADLMQSGMHAAGLVDVAGGLFAEQGKTPFAVMGMLLAAVILCAYVGGLKDSLGNTGVNGVYQTVCALAVCTVATVPFLECVRAVNDAL